LNVCLVQVEDIRGRASALISIIGVSSCPSQNIALLPKL
jgi:hypothetical protein